MLEPVDIDVQRRHGRPAGAPARASARHGRARAHDSAARSARRAGPGGGAPAPPLAVRLRPGIPQAPTIFPASSSNGSFVVETQTSGRSWKVSRSRRSTIGSPVQHDTLLILAGRGRMRRAEQVEVRLPDELLHRVAAAEAGSKAGADEYEPALAILEEHSLPRICEEVTHAPNAPTPLPRGSTTTPSIWIRAHHESRSWLDPFLIGSSALRLIRANPQTARRHAWRGKAALSRMALQAAGTPTTVRQRATADRSAKPRSARSAA